MSEAEVIQIDTGIQPTAVQQARATALKRFNWYFIYTPLVVLLLILLVLTGLLLWGALSPQIVGTREFVSGVADIVIILTALPMTVACLVPPLALVGFTIYRRQKNQVEQRPYGRIQPLFWRLDNMIDTAREKGEPILPKLSQPVIRLNAILAYITTLIDHLVSIIRH